jgi:hypothetical protein
VIQRHDALQHVARRNLHRFAALPRGIVDHLRRRARSPGSRPDRIEIRHHHQVALRVERLPVFLEAHVVAGDRLVKDRYRQMRRIELHELFRRHRLAARHAGDVRHGAVDLLDAVLAQPNPQCVGCRACAKEFNVCWL